MTRRRSGGRSATVCGEPGRNDRRLRRAFYRNRHAYYAPLWPWLECRAAALLQVPAWQLVKVGQIVGAFFAPLIAYLLWKRLAAPRFGHLSWAHRRR